jgi:hypothetical protein
MIGFCYAQTFLAKYRVFGSLLGWPLDNDFTFILKFYQFFGGSFIPPSSSLSKFVMVTMSDLKIFVQGSLYFTELLLLFMCFSRRLSFVLIPFIIIFHLVFFITAGVFFWKWILVNIFAFVLLIKFQKYKSRNLLLLFFILITGKSIFLTSDLGWKDPSNFKHNVWMVNSSACINDAKYPSEWQFEENGMKFSSLNPKIFYPFTKQMAMSWKFFKISESQILQDKLDRLIGKSLRSKTVHFFNHIWPIDKYYCDISIDKIDQIKLIKFDITFGERDEIIKSKSVIGTQYTFHREQ